MAKINQLNQSLVESYVMAEIIYHQQQEGTETAPQQEHTAKYTTWLSAMEAFLTTDMRRFIPQLCKENALGHPISNMQVCNRGGEAIIRVEVGQAPLHSVSLNSPYDAETLSAMTGVDLTPLKSDQPGMPLLLARYLGEGELLYTPAFNRLRSGLFHKTAELLLPLHCPHKVSHEIIEEPDNDHIKLQSLSSFLKLDDAVNDFMRTCPDRFKPGQFDRIRLFSTPLMGRSVLATLEPVHNIVEDHPTRMLLEVTPGHSLSNTPLKYVLEPDQLQTHIAGIYRDGRLEFTPTFAGIRNQAIKRHLQGSQYNQAVEPGNFLHYPALIQYRSVERGREVPQPRNVRLQFPTGLDALQHLLSFNPSDFDADLVTGSARARQITDCALVTMNGNLIAEMNLRPRSVADMQDGLLLQFENNFAHQLSHYLGQEKDTVLQVARYGEDRLLTVTAATAALRDRLLRSTELQRIEKLSNNLLRFMPVHPGDYRVAVTIKAGPTGLLPFHVIPPVEREFQYGSFKDAFTALSILPEACYRIDTGDTYPVISSTKLWAPGAESPLLTRQLVAPTALYSGQVMTHFDPSQLIGKHANAVQEAQEIARQQQYPFHITPHMQRLLATQITHPDGLKGKRHQ